MTTRHALEATARALGFARCHVARASALPELRAEVGRRAAAGWYGDLPWFISSDRLDRVCDAALTVEGARSVVTVVAPYWSTLDLPPGDEALRGRVARYAWGRDYHRVLEWRLRKLARWLRAQGHAARPYVDYGPLAERAYARRAGAGWLGKNACLLSRELGSWTVLGACITDAAFEPDAPAPGSCGACTRCVAACPTGCIVAPGAVVSDRCVSSLTIERRGPIPRALRPLLGDWLFGCDACQDVCPAGGPTEPWPELRPRSLDDAAPDLLALLALDDAAFRLRFQGRALSRAGRDGLLRNACVVLGNLADDRAGAALARVLANDPSALVRGHAAWALGRVGGRAACAALDAALQRDPDAYVREEAAAAREAGAAVRGVDRMVLARWLAGADHFPRGRGVAFASPVRGAPMA